MSDPTRPLTTPDLLLKSPEELDRILVNSHPLMVEAFYLASVPQWYDLPLFAAIRDKDDGREEGLIDRLKRYSFISPLYYREEAEPAYFVRAQERAILQRRWIAEDPAAYEAAHQRALAFWEDHPDPNPFAQAQNRLYHLLFVNFDEGIDYLVDRFRTYRNDRHFPAIERLLDVAREAQEYLTLREDRSVVALDQLLTYLGMRLAQLRGDWEDSERDLQALRQKGDRLDRRLRPYVLRAQGYNRSHRGKYAEAIQSLKEALGEFDQQLAIDGGSAIIHAERAYTMIALGDAHADLAASVGGYNEREQLGPGLWHRLRAVFYFFLSLPLVLYLSRNLGRRIWRPQFWPALIGLDWIIGRLFATAARYYRQADPILEKHGDPAEGGVADEKLAFLYLRLGGAQQAERLFSRLLTEEETPLGPYRQSSVRVGLADACLQLGKAELALKPLHTALPVLAAYGDRELGARARELLGEALFATGEEKEAIKHFGMACHGYQERGNWIGATRIVERLEGRVQLGDLVEAAREQAKQVIGSLRRRQYPGSYRHPLLIRFRQLMLILLPVVLILVPLLTITMDTATGLAPEIRFRPAPILDPNQIVTLTLSQGVVAANVSCVVVSHTLLWIAVALILAYLVLSLVLGYAAIAFTPLHSVEARGRGATVYLDDQDIAVGQETTSWLNDQGSVVALEASAPSLPWMGVSQFVKADVSMWHRPLQDGSSFGLGATQESLVIGGSTRWYTSLRERVSRLVPSAAHVIDLDYSVLRSPLGALYALNLLCVGLLGVLAAFDKEGLILYDLPGIQYSVVDLYPYLFFFLVVAPLWWGVVQPLRQRIYLKPHSRFPLWLLGAGLLLALVQVLLHFRPLLTVVNLYLPLVTLILLVSAEIALWRAQMAGQKVYPALVRLGTAVVVTIVCLLMVSVVWREMRAYHYLVQGNSLRDCALDTDKACLSKDPLADAIDAYGRAADIGGRAIWGIDTKPATRIRVGIPAPSSFTWLKALTSRAALQTQLSQYDKAIQSLDEVLKFTDRPDEVYAWRALARLTQGTRRAERGGLEIDQVQFELAIRDLGEAVQLNDAEASYYLWRGVAHHALGYVSRGTGPVEQVQPVQLSEGFDDYQRALKLGVAGEGGLTSDQREQVLIGLGWISYERSYEPKNFQKAREWFQEAKKANPQSSEARLGEGYALYALEQFEEALSVWEKAAELKPKDPTILLSLGTAHWKLGGEAGRVLGRDRCEEYSRSVNYFTQAVDRENLWPQLDKDVAFTYRTRGNVQWLLSTCPGLDKVAMTENAVDSYTQALQLDGDNAFYWHMRGRLSYSVWRTLNGLGKGADPRALKWLGTGLEDLEQALERDPHDNAKDDYQPKQWIEYILKAVDGVLNRGDDLFATGDYVTALAYYERVANNVPQNTRAAFKAGLASLAIGKQGEALVWYETGLERARLTNKVPEAQLAFLELSIQASELGLAAAPVSSLFQKSGILLEARDAESALTLALVSLIRGDLKQSAQLYNRGLELAATDHKIEIVKAAAEKLRDFLLQHPDISRTNAYWPLHDDIAVRERLVVTLDRPDLYWRYRAEFGFRLLVDRQLLKQEPGHEEPYEEIFASIIDDIERAYALKPEEHQAIRDFFVDANIGWLFLRRGDDYTKEQNYEQALADYKEAARRIRPASENAALDLTEAIFKAGLTALRLEQFGQATAWYDEGLELVRRHSVEFGLDRKVAPAIEALQALQEENRDLAPAVEPILNKLEELR